MKTWLADFLEKNPTDPANIVRYRGGVGERKGNYTVSNFVGHPVHYQHGNEWKPITLAHSQGDWEGSDFGWNGFAVTYKKKILYQPNAIIFNGVVYPLTFYLDADNFRYVAGVPNIGEFVIQFTESGVKEILTIPEPLDGVLEFDVDHKAKPDGLHKSERRIISSVSDKQRGELFILTPEMTYPMVIDPDYNEDGSLTTWLRGADVTYATARSTCATHSSGSGYIYVGQVNTYEVWRAAIAIQTAGIPDADTVTKVNLNLYIGNDTSTTNFDIKIKKYNWSASNPITSGNRETVYDGILSSAADADWGNTSSIVINTWIPSPNLDTSWVSKTGNTYYGIMSSRDASSTIPTGTERIATAFSSLTVIHSGSSRSGRLSLLGVG